MTTKFGRVPLWLYESGASLQAIATYGWLAGKYGHYSKISPSYGALAKELGVSRGSAIAYVQALIEVRAVRIKTSGAKDQSSNTYELAFDRPFPTEAQAEGGRNTDQSDLGESNPQATGGQNTDLVSPPTSGGQNADRGGQPAVHDIDVLLDKNQTSSYLPPEPAEASAPEPQEEDGYAFEPHPDAVALIDKVDLGDKVLAEKLRAEAERLLTAKLAEGWTVSALLKRFEGCTIGARNPPGVFMDRIRGLGAPPRPKTASNAPLPPWCGECGDGNPAARLKATLRTLDGTVGGTRCPRCHPSQTGN